MLELVNVHKSFGAVNVIKGITMSFSAGRFYALIGPNGCGKTSILNIIAGFYHVDRGEVVFDNGNRHTINRLTPARRARLGIGVTFQEPRGFGEFSVEENLYLAMMQKGSDSVFRTGLQKVPSDFSSARMNELLEWGLLLDNRHDKVSSLSYGKRKILDILCLLGRGCGAIMLDEPFAGVDPKSLETILELLQEKLKRNTGTVVIVSHEPSIVQDVVDKVFLLDEGRILLEGLPSEVIASRTFRKVFLG